MDSLLSTETTGMFHLAGPRRAGSSCVVFEVDKPDVQGSGEGRTSSRSRGDFQTHLLVTTLWRVCQEIALLRDEPLDLPILAM